MAPTGRTGFCARVWAVLGKCLRCGELGATSIEYLLVAALVVVLFAAVRFTLLAMLQDLYKFLIQTICSPVM